MRRRLRQLAPAQISCDHHRIYRKPAVPSVLTFRWRCASPATCHSQAADQPHLHHSWNLRQLSD